MRLFLVVGLLVSAGCAHAKTSSSSQSCVDNPKIYEAKSAELKRLEEEDQADRTGDLKAIDWPKVAARDLERREKVSAIFAEGCLQTSKDYYRAALIFQHGDTADHVP